MHSFIHGGVWIIFCVWCRLVHGLFLSTLFPLLQEVMCEGCRFGSHKQHNHDFVAHVAANERSRMKDIGQRTRALSSALQGRIDALNASSKKCTNSAHGVKQEIKLQFDRIRKALLERKKKLTFAADQLLQVLYSLNHTASSVWFVTFIIARMIPHSGRWLSFVCTLMPHDLCAPVACSADGNVTTDLPYRFKWSLSRTSDLAQR